MGKAIAIHSFRGGTGKSFIATNLALTYASKGENVCLLDLDFRAPTLGSTFQSVKPRFTMNDYLDGSCMEEDVLTDVSSMYGTTGKLVVALASQSPEEMQEYMVKGRSWGMKALEQLHRLKKTLIKNLGFNYVLLDTSPGMQYSSINAVCVADIVLSIVSMDESDIEGTKSTIESVYKPLDKRVFFLFEKYPYQNETPILKEEMDEVCKMLDPSKSSLVGIIPCSCEVLRSKRQSIFILDNPAHPVKTAIADLSEKLTDVF